MNNCFFEDKQIKYIGFLVDIYDFMEGSKVISELIIPDVKEIQEQHQEFPGELKNDFDYFSDGTIIIYELI